LRKRLLSEGYPIINKGSPENIFDEELEHAVLHFQKLHGLKQDGIVGFYTLKDLNVPIKDRIRQIELNLERLRWISGNLGKRYVKVNIADFTLDVVESHKNILHMKVVVGKPFWNTPVFSEKIRYLVLNPAWNIPRSIAISEVIPSIQKDPSYLAKKNMKVLKGWGKNEEEISPESIDWESVHANNFAYRFRQEPGSLNPLGSIKFMFPNKFGVYLHDTQSKSLFERNIRSFSHGCIRLEQPVELAEYLLKNDPKWSKARIITEIRKAGTQQIRLPEPVNIHILYLTAWVDAEGFLNFRTDIYGRDKKLDEALTKRPPFL
jgi:murein L,D-transpeptidase YcbB/YkuD